MEEKRSSVGGPILGVIGLLAAAGLGYYAWELHGHGQTLAETLERTMAEKNLCTEGLARERQAAGDLNKGLSGCAEEATKIKAEKAAIEKLKTDLEANLNASRAELDELRKQRAQTEARLAAFRALTEKFRRMIDLGQIKVQIRDGKMMLKLPEEILFPSGSAELSEKGKAALTEVATNLKTFPERNFMIAGHTDDVQLAKGSQYHSNWALSTARAVTVTEFLIGGGMRPQQLGAAGYSQYDPVSKTRKQENRRIEIVLQPNIDELPQFPDDLVNGGDKKAAPAAPAAPAPKAP